MTANTMPLSKCLFLVKNAKLLEFENRFIKFNVLNCDTHFLIETALPTDANKFHIADIYCPKVV